MWRLGLIQSDEVLKEEGPGFVRGMQTRDRGVRKDQDWIKFTFFLRLN
jgi:hypothetical protein